MSQNKPTLSRTELEKLSKEELFNLAKKLQNVSIAQQKRKQDIYLENAHAKQILFHKDQHRVRLFMGGNRSGKSTGGVNEDIWYATGTHPYRRISTPNKGLIVASDFENSVRDVIVPKILEWAPLGAIKETEKNQNGVIKKITFSNGSTIDIKSHDQSEKIFESSDYDWAHLDEPPPKKIWTAIWRGLTDRGGSAWFTLTPISEPWIAEVYERSVKGDPLYWSVFVNSYDNAKNLGQGDLELGTKRLKEFEAELDPDERIARIEGQFLHLQGRVFKEWDRKRHLIDEFVWPAQWPIVESIDPHPRKPWAITWVGITENNTKILMKTIKVEGVVEDIAAAMIRERKCLGIENDIRPKITNTYIDNYAMVESMIGEKKPILDSLNDLIGPKLGYPKVQTCPKDIPQKISLFKEWLKFRQTSYGEIAEFYVWDNDGNNEFVHEIEHYVWQRYRTGSRTGYKDLPRKENDDVIDTVLQLCLCNLGNVDHNVPYRITKGATTYTGRGSLNGRESRTL